ncbi:MAG TPA: alkyl hydroperoxide reductase, partial [Blastocatellia bacterium]|nr:alkyl hydroperoxide reductase [Blastocatellia bacterium]
FMNLLKSLFISVFSMVNLAILAVGVWMLARGVNRLAWIGVVLSALPFV